MKTTDETTVKVDPNLFTKEELAKDCDKYRSKWIDEMKRRARIENRCRAEAIITVIAVICMAFMLGAEMYRDLKPFDKYIPEGYYLSQEYYVASSGDLIQEVLDNVRADVFPMRYVPDDPWIREIKKLNPDIDCSLFDADTTVIIPVFRELPDAPEPVMHVPSE